MQHTTRHVTGADAHRALSTEQEGQARRFSETLAGHQSAAVAFSGGVDSSVVLALAIRTLGASNVTGVLGVSPSLAQAERAGAHLVAEQIGAELIEIETREMGDMNYVANGVDRCYFCKHELYTRTAAEVTQAVGAEVLLNGENADDAVRDDRPGRRAAAELGVRSPLVEANLGKRQVRDLARGLDLPVWDKPSSPCLASRIPHAVPVTISRLNQVELAEAALRQLGLVQLRVRHGGETATVELGLADHARLAHPMLRRAVVEAVQASGFVAVEIAEKPLHRD